MKDMNNDSKNTNPFSHTEKALAEFRARMSSLKQKLDQWNEALEAEAAKASEPPK